MYLVGTEAMSSDSIVEVCDGKGKCASVDFGARWVQPDELGLEQGSLLFPKVEFFIKGDI